MIDPDRLDFSLLSDEDNLLDLDFTEEDGTDPLGVNAFLKQKASEYRKNNLTAIHAVRLDGKLVAFFTLSMFAIQVKELQDKEKIGDSNLVSYPAILLGQMGVDKKFRNQGIGYWICQFCLGLAQEIGQRVACRYLMLETNEQKSSYYKRLLFEQSSKKSQKIWMYRRVL